MAMSPLPRHARPRGRRALASAYDDIRRELVGVKSARWSEQMEVVRLTALTDELSGQVAALQAEIAQLRGQLEAALSRPPVVVSEPAPAAPPQPSVDSAQQVALIGEIAELRRLVGHQQQLLADLTMRLLDLLTRFVPVAPPAAAAGPGDPAAPPAASSEGEQHYYLPPADLVMDDETASRLKVIREAFGR
jgi:uncharacterized coiled-coil protein SlyX